MLDLKLQMVKRPKLFPVERANRPRTECITQIKTKSSLEKVNLAHLLAVKTNEKREKINKKFKRETPSVRKV